MLLAPEWFVEEYRANVKHVFQSDGFKMKSTVSPEGSINGLTVKWPYFGTFEMGEYQRGSETPPANPDQGMLQATLKDYDALYEIFQADLTKMTANEKAAAHQAGGKAVGRKSDAIIMNAANDACIAAGDKTVGDGTGDWDLFQAQAVAEELVDDDMVPSDGNITAVIPWRWFNIMMLYKEFNSSEWVGADLGFPRMTRAKSWNGVVWVPFSKKELIVPAADEAFGFIYHRTALGYATNYEGAVMMDWDNRKKCWTVRFDLQACAMALFPNAAGIRRLHFATDTALERPVERTQAVA